MSTHLDLSDLFCLPLNATVMVNDANPSHELFVRREQGGEGREGGMERVKEGEGERGRDGKSEGGGKGWKE